MVTADEDSDDSDHSDALRALERLFRVTEERCLTVAEMQAFRQALELSRRLRDAGAT